VKLYRALQLGMTDVKVASSQSFGNANSWTWMAMFDWGIPPKLRRGCDVGE
jgi:hypothetical protein